MHKILKGHISPETAHLSFGYPYDRKTRCVRREYVERPERGSNAGQERYVTQTTHPSFNDVYSAFIVRSGREAADAWAREQIEADRVLWNAPKNSTYSPVVVIAEKPLPDGSGRVGVEPVRVSPYASVEAIRELLEARDALAPHQERYLTSILAYYERTAAAKAS
jgi:hypothetical protein